jgi:hypothetical protein
MWPLPLQSQVGHPFKAVGPHLTNPEPLPCAEAKLL